MRFMCGLCATSVRYLVGFGAVFVRAPDIVYTKKNVLEHAVFLLKSLV